MNQNETTPVTDPKLAMEFVDCVLGFIKGREVELGAPVGPIMMLLYLARILLGFARDPDEDGSGEFIAGLANERHTREYAGTERPQ
jgi:hypothetical protein